MANPKVIYKNGFLRVLLPSGEMLPETELKISNDVEQKGKALVTVTFECDLDLTEKSNVVFEIKGTTLKEILDKTLPNEPKDDK